MRGRSRIRAAAEGGIPRTCTYVKCDVGMMPPASKPTGETIPPPDLLLLSYTGCFTFMKWFENLRALYKCPVACSTCPIRRPARSRMKWCSTW